MTVVVKHLQRYMLLYCGLAIHLLFYLSAFQTRWLDIFFSGDALHHCCQGMDFYQVPKGAYAFWHGGSLSGEGLPAGSEYAHEYVSNFNVYHPLFTLVLGSWLALFPPNVSFHIWMYIKLPLMLGLVLYFYHVFRASKYTQFAIFVLLASATQYLEIAISQYQFALNAFLLLFLLCLARGNAQKAGGLFYLGSLLVKPIGLLWLPALLRRRQWWVVLIGAGGFLLCTVPFLFKGLGSYYIDYLRFYLSGPDLEGPDQIITLGALLKFSMPLSDQPVIWLQRFCLGIVVLFGVMKRVDIFKAIFLAVVYFLLFYNRVYEYHYTTLTPVLAVCVVRSPAFQTRIARLLIVLTCLPSVFVLLNMLGIGVTFNAFYGPNPTLFGWQLLVASKVVPLLLLTVYMLRADAVALWDRARACGSYCASRLKGKG